MRKLVLTAVLGFLLACAGALDSMTPEMPFALPADTHTTNIDLNTTNGVTTTRVAFTAAESDAATLQAELEAALAAEGWTVTSGSGAVAGTKGSQSIQILVSSGSFEVVWVH